MMLDRRRRFRPTQSRHDDVPEMDEPMGEPSPLPGNPVVVPRELHGLSRKLIDPDALKVMYRLLRAGHRAFLVGGGVRDLLLRRKPKDFDIGTDAQPEAVRRLFRNSRSIGRRFPIIHVFFHGGKIVEVSTFRAESDPDVDAVDLAPKKIDNTYGDPLTDALRRDLTINGLFYDLHSYSIVDYVGGLRDLKGGVIRIIGDPERRIIEDPVRMIRAIRHAARVRFVIEEDTYQAICRNSGRICDCSQARVFEEFSRELRGGCAYPSFQVLEATGLLNYLFVELGKSLAENHDEVWERVRLVLEKVDTLIAEGHDCPVRVVLLALVLGNLRKDFFSSEQVEEGLPTLSDFFQTSVSTLPDEAASDVVPRSFRQSLPRRHALVPLLGEVVDALFREMGVSKKDREDLAFLLYYHYVIFTYSAHDQELPADFARVAGDLSLLLDITDFDVAARQCKARYARALEELSLGHVREPRRRPRRRRRGRAPHEENQNQTDE